MPFRRKILNIWRERLKTLNPGQWKRRVRWVEGIAKVGRHWSQWDYYWVMGCQRERKSERGRLRNRRVWSWVLRYSRFKVLWGPVYHWNMKGRRPKGIWVSKWSNFINWRVWLGVPSESFKNVWERFIHSSWSKWKAVAESQGESKNWEATD